MDEALQQVLTYAPIPVVATIAGGLLPLFFDPGPRVRSSIQHFAAGLVFAAVAAELLPKILEAHSLVATISGFVIGVGLMLDTLIVRTFVLPSLVALLGRWFWWPIRIPLPAAVRWPPPR